MAEIYIYSCKYTTDNDIIIQKNYQWFKFIIIAVLLLQDQDCLIWNMNIMLGTASITTYNINTLRPRQNGCHFADDTFKHIFLSEIFRILIKISLKFFPMGPINNIPALVQIMAWRRPGDKPLSEPMLVNLLTHICVTRPQWVNLWSAMRIHEILLVILFKGYLKSPIAKETL